MESILYPPSHHEKDKMLLISGFEEENHGQRSPHARDQPPRTPAVSLPLPAKFRGHQDFFITDAEQQQAQ
ncbi:MAG: hypothetical protein HGA53_07660, partial [Anaerolineaceae bacterium]|nr:hypothetical protein [Anaerolineaceae bacterium]